MSDDPLQNFDDLLDSDYRNRVIEVMTEWCFDESYTQNPARADLMEHYLSKPLWAFINMVQKERKAGASLRIEAVKNLAIKVDDIVYMLRYKTRPLYPEHISILDGAWKWLQLPDLETAVDDELRRMRENEKQMKEVINHAKEEAFQESGAEGSRISRANRVEILLMIGKKVIEEKKCNQFKSISIFAKEIERKLAKAEFFYVTSKGEKKRLEQTWESIRKLPEIKKLYNDTFNYR